MFHVKHIKEVNMKLNELLKLIPANEQVLIDTEYLLYDGDIAHLPNIILDRNYVVYGILPEYKRLYIKVKEA